MSQTKYNYTRKLYNTSGQITTEETTYTVAKEVINDDTGNIRYYIKYFRGTFVDPKSSEFTRLKKHAEFRSVNEIAFINYIKYLVNGGSVYLRNAERELL